ncbi:MAG: hypothetical protein GXP33_16175 [Spirochaetes bacterium]|nr:hypothetical protein [Spirochaetota bacterium]
MKYSKNSGFNMRKTVLVLTLTAASFFLFYSCSQLGIVSKTDRINMFISDLNSSTGDQGSADKIMKNISPDAAMYDQIKTIVWWEASVLASKNKAFSVTGLSESNTGNTVTGHITSDGGLDAAITFTMVSDSGSYFSWLIGAITIDGVNNNEPIIN